MKAISPILALMFSLLLGCVIIPIPTAEHQIEGSKTRGEITERTLKFMRPGATTREKTLLTLGGPDSVWNNETIFAYQWLMVGGYVFVGFGVGSPAGMGGHADTAAWYNKYVLLVEYDARNIVKRCEVIRVNGQSAPIDRELIEKWLASGRSESAETCIRSG
jgi:hypothetical protein